MKANYIENGYFILRNFFDDKEIAPIFDIINKFHLAWQGDNKEFYESKAINSAYLTNKNYLNNAQRSILFEFISTNKLINIVAQTSIIKPAFMNTQLFFNPMNLEQRNYWHRDTQYHLTLSEQQQALSKSEVIHFRIALADEPGIELIPGTHKRWDSEEELAIRLEQAGNNNYNNVSTGVTVPLNKGDLLVFSANMIHRGLYGKKRLSFDIIFCESEENLVKFVNNDCLPNENQMKSMQNNIAFKNTIKIKTQQHKTS